MSNPHYIKVHRGEDPSPDTKQQPASFSEQTKNWHERATKICHGITLIQLPCLTRKTTPTSTARRLIPLQHRAVISSPMLGSSSGRDHVILIDRIPDVAKHLVHDNPHKIKPGLKASER
ncbi:hypothetical protein BFJ66_g13851 [Fusarium oxysporum f. sp. cepae]|uniref:Uncharacterized protein n=1 Tax=Fusarium oxysporum f. sp. cepae TaxID=396571 RepID=A0A3L6NKX6_FUSOX|nr:hypothetical protein BFJ65_g9106 [Fusarium oxysporum f. sp. cepae]RKK34845.1 hypothetical protein BFJ67_g13588 [Fusarium oxysporum f. sp. cepae]RKK35679.1 hypothetical protein BFJ66_g13851 [Fusarium oxysporum f. sp. cepae]